MTAGFWIAAGSMTLLAVGLLAVPLWREGRRRGTTPVGAFAALALAPLAVGLYLHVSTWNAEDAATSAAVDQEFALAEQLAQRLSNEPDNVDGWALLGRTYLQLGEYASARQALEQAWDRSPNPDDALKLSYAESMLFSDESTVHGLAGDLVDQVVASSPGNQRALWWGGLIALEREQPRVAIERWTALLATNPPPEIVNLIREQLVMLGAADAAASASAAAASGAAPSAAAPSAAAPSAAAGAPDAGVSIELVVDIAADLPLDNVGPGALFYIAARSPTGGPPLAVEQHPVSAVPGRFVLSESDSMLPGNSLAGHSVVSVVARISRGGGANEQPGDFYGELEVSLPAAAPLNLKIDRIVAEP